MNASYYALGMAALIGVTAQAALRTEHFDREPANWEGVNHRNTHFPPRSVVQDFGYSAATSHAGGQRGEWGGRIQAAGEPAYYGYRLPQSKDLDSSVTAQGKIRVAPGGGHFLVGFFNAETLNEWRTPNTMVIRINGRGETFHCHIEYCTRLWRAGAGVIGDLVPGRSITPKPLESGRVYNWKLTYDPRAAEGRGQFVLTLDGERAECEFTESHRREGARFTHFGLVPVMKSWDDAGEVWLDDVAIDGAAFDFREDPQWDALGNRRAYETILTRPRFDFGWSPTRFAMGEKEGELGGVVFRGDCREPARMACYGDRLSTLTLATPLTARGKLTMLRGVSDSTASIGFYHSKWSMESNPSQQSSIPKDFLGVNIEGPSSEGFYFYPVYRVHGDDAGSWRGDPDQALRIRPDRSVHDWFLTYDPAGADGRGRITVGLDGQVCTLDLEAGHQAVGASFDRFGLCTPWIDGNSVTVYFDDLTYTCAPEPAP